MMAKKQLSQEDYGHISSVLVECKGKISCASRELDVSRWTMYRYIEKHPGLWDAVVEGQMVACGFDPTSPKYRKIHDCIGPGNYSFLAARTGYSRVHVFSVLRGSRDASLKCYTSLSTASGVPLADLLEYVNTISVVPRAKAIRQVISKETRKL